VIGQLFVYVSVVDLCYRVRALKRSTKQSSSVSYSSKGREGKGGREKDGREMGGEEKRWMANFRTLKTPLVLCFVCYSDPGVR